MQKALGGIESDDDIHGIQEDSAEVAPKSLDRKHAPGDGVNVSTPQPALETAPAAAVPSADVDEAVWLTCGETVLFVEPLITKKF